MSGADDMGVSRQVSPAEKEPPPCTVTRNAPLNRVRFTFPFCFLQGAGACVLTPSRVSAAQGMAEGGRCQARFYDGRSIQRGASSLQLYYFGLLYLARPDSRERSVIVRRHRCPAPLQNFPLLWLRRQDTLPLHPSN